MCAGGYTAVIADPPTRSDNARVGKFSPHKKLPTPSPRLWRVCACGVWPVL